MCTFRVLNLKAQGAFVALYILSRFIAVVNYVANLKESHKGYRGKALKEKYPSEQSS